MCNDKEQGRKNTTGYSESPHLKYFQYFFSTLHKSVNIDKTYNSWLKRMSTRSAPNYGGENLWLIYYVVKHFILIYWSIFLFLSFWSLWSCCNCLHSSFSVLKYKANIFRYTLNLKKWLYILLFVRALNGFQFAGWNIVS